MSSGKDISYSVFIISCQENSSKLIENIDAGSVL